MNAQEFAARLNRREYGSEITMAEEAEAKAAGLVVVFGYSDDNVELRGAIHEEVGAFDGATLHVGQTGLIPEWTGYDGISEEDATAYFQRKKATHQSIEAVWCPKETEADTEPFASWAYKTAIPHAAFDVMEDGDLYCRGIVFALADVRGAAA